MPSPALSRHSVVPDVELWKLPEPPTRLEEDLRRFARYFGILAGANSGTGVFD